MKSLTAITLLVLLAGSYAQTNTTTNIVSCATTQTDAFCANQTGVSGLCCAVVNVQTKTATATTWTTTQQSFQCLSAELVRANSTIVYTAGTSQSTYACVSSNVAEVKACENTDSCDPGFCCANRSITWR
jgi:hypothetical protein